MSIVDCRDAGRVFDFFEEISLIPRGSGRTGRIEEYLVSFAEKNNFRYYHDKSGNVIIFKDGSKGRENEQPVILQGHTDMVWEKESGSDFSFENSGLKLSVSGDFLSAEGTTLGADDGIAVAVMLSILSDSTLSHPPVEAVFTADEEIGMLGAAALDASVLRGNRMINLDSEAENVFWVSCAGGTRIDISLPVSVCENRTDAYRITISGLHGGHSGTEIDKGYAGATILGGRLLGRLVLEDKNIRIAGIDGGRMDNAITRECVMTVCTDVNPENTIADFFEKTAAEYPNDGGISIKSEKVAVSEAFDTESSSDIIALMATFPFGVIKMSDSIEGLVQTSVNLGIVRTDDDSVSFGFSVRSSVNSEKEALVDSIVSSAEKYTDKIRTYGDYSAWEYKENSPLRETMVSVYDTLFGRKPETAAIHAGLECGIFGGKIPDLDCVSLGPDIYDIHTPSERLSISSAVRIYRLVISTLEQI